ncbi:MAG: DUF192 domain-containing protein [Armatimonadetes bacterium]|nr:DUF192 domain-containing protein [Armatimonadota bacterium]
MRVTVRPGGEVLAEDVEIARSLSSRLWGLIGKPRGSVLVLPRCRQVHTFFMRYPVDLVCADSEWRVVRVRCGLEPWRIGPYCREAAFTIELPAGSASSVSVGDMLALDADGS